MNIKNSIIKKFTLFIPTILVYFLFIINLILIVHPLLVDTALILCFLLVMVALVHKDYSESLSKVYLYFSSITIGIYECEHYGLIGGALSFEIIYSFSVLIIYLLVPLHLFKQRIKIDQYILIWISSPFIGLYILITRFYINNLSILDPNFAYKFISVVTLSYFTIAFFLYIIHSDTHKWVQTKCEQVTAKMGKIHLPKFLLPTIDIPKQNLSFAITLVFIILATIFFI